VTIIKKSGKKEEFSIGKVKSSLTAVCNEANQPLSEKEMGRIISEVQQFIKDKQMMTTQQIDVIITGLLYTRGYYVILEHYVKYGVKR